MAARASVWKRLTVWASAATSGLKSLTATCGVELQVVGAIHPAHGPDADELGDVVLSDAASCRHNGIAAGSIESR